MRKHLVGVVVLLVALAAETAGVSAADRALCDAYTAEAVKAARAVRSGNCGYALGHPQWSLDPNVHRRWCLFASEDSVDRERDERRRKVSFCSVCRDYAAGAAGLAQRATADRCPVGGPRWSRSAQDHFHWCMGLKEFRNWVAGFGVPEPGVLEGENAAREEELGRCLVGKTRDPLSQAPTARRGSGAVPARDAQRGTSRARRSREGNS